MGGDADRSERRGNPTYYLSVLAVAAGGAVVVVGATENTAAAVVGGLAAWMVGGLFGLIFGIPRYAASEIERQEQSKSNPEAVKYRGNTNLEQISDWLTKILVGVGLTQFRAIARGVSDAAEELGQALSGTGSDGATVLALGLILATSIPGFVFFYLWSRVYLPRLFGEAEQLSN